MKYVRVRTYDRACTVTVMIFVVWRAMDGSTFCDKNVQISSLYCSFTVFYSFLGDLLTGLLAIKKHMFFCIKQATGYCVLYNDINWLL